MPQNPNQFYILNGLPCRVLHQGAAEKYVPAKGFVPISVIELLLEGQNISKEEFDSNIRKIAINST